MPLTLKQVAVIKGLLARGEKQQDIAAFFRTNGGRIAEINTGQTFADVRAAKRNLPSLSSAPEIHQARRALRMAHRAIESALISLDQYEETERG